jgi:hypothetical protein
VTTHRDVSAAEAQVGVRTTEITSGKYKRIDSNFAPLTEEGRAYIQNRIDAIYTVFVDDVARNRGVSLDVVLQDMADGRVFVGVDAISNGLVDGVATWEDVLGMKHNVGRAVAATAELVADACDTPTEGTMEDVSTTEQEPAVSVEINPAEAERLRIQGVLAQSLPGHEALVNALAFDGVTTPEQAAVRIVDAERATRESMAVAMVDVSPSPVKGSGGDSDAVEDKLKARWEATAALRALYDNNYESYAHASSLKDAKVADGTVRVFSKTK